MLPLKLEVPSKDTYNNGTILTDAKVSEAKYRNLMEMLLDGTVYITLR